MGGGADWPGVACATRMTSTLPPAVLGGWDARTARQAFLGTVAAPVLWYPKLLIAARTIDGQQIVLPDNVAGEILTSAVVTAFVAGTKALVRTQTGSVYELGAPRPDFADANPDADTTTAQGKVALINYARHGNTDGSRAY